MNGIPKTPSQIRLEAVVACAANGMTRREAAERVGISYACVCLWARRYGLHFKKRKRAPDGRAKTMAVLYSDGYTLQQIGDQFSVTRERVRQILSRGFGFNFASGGAHAKLSERKARAAEKRDGRYLKKYGCTFDQWKEMLAAGATYAFNAQRRNAARRGIAWEMTHWEWWQIWKRSGKWGMRGRRGQDYVMARDNDEGPYSASNIKIIRAVENLSDRKAKKSGLPIGVSHTMSGKYTAQRMIGGRVVYLGTHLTPELAHAAYLQADAEARV